LLTHLNPLF